MKKWCQELELTCQEQELTFQEQELTCQEQELTCQEYLPDRIHHPRGPPPGGQSTPPSLTITRQQCPHQLLGS